MKDYEDVLGRIRKTRTEAWDRLYSVGKFNDEIVCSAGKRSGVHILCCSCNVFLRMNACGHIALCRRNFDIDARVASSMRLFALQGKEVAYMCETAVARNGIAQAAG